MVKRKVIIAVIGSTVPLKRYEDIAYEMGKLIAEKGWLLLTGGLEGIMEKACEGAKESGGITIGILPGVNKEKANKYVDIPIATGLQHASNNIVVQSADIIISIGSGYGTLSQMALAMKLQKKIISINSWDIDEEVIRADDPTSAIKEIEKLLKKS